MQFICFVEIAPRNSVNTGKYLDIHTNENWTCHAVSQVTNKGTEQWQIQDFPNDGQ